MKARRQKVIINILFLLFLLLQYPLWLGNSSFIKTWQLKQEISQQQTQNLELGERNQALLAEVVDLKQGLSAIEERARVELGMIKKDETFYHIIKVPNKGK